MDAYQNILERRSIRKYTDQKIDDETLQKIILAGTYAPSARNSQSSIIIAVTNKEVRDRLSELNAKVHGKKVDEFYGAEVVLVVLADKDIPSYLYDGSLVMGNLMNAANALGVGSCWIHRAKEVFETSEGKAILEELGIKGNYEGIGHCILGYPNEKPLLHKRKDNFVYYIK